MSDLINQPDATRLIFGLRDTGYSFNTAAADIIDNSIAADATEVNVQIEIMEDGRKFVFFGDDGSGMDYDELFDAMRYGAPVRANLASLGKFGLGLKTASSSVCRKYSVLSRKSGDAVLEKLTWDLDYVADCNRWEMLREPVSGGERETFEELCGKRGTLVIWENCDRILAREYDEPGGAKERLAIGQLYRRLKEHVSVIYYRFLDHEDDRQRNITISINGEAVEPWNPFYPEKADQVLPEVQQTLEIETEDGEIETAHIRAWILPNSRDLTDEEKKIARITNRGQGFYIHREGRLIQQGGWLGVFGAVEPHYSLLRVEFDFDHKLDDAFHVPVDKSKIRFDPALEEALKELLAPTYREAGNRYRRKERAVIVERGVDHTSSNKAIGGTPNTKKPAILSADPSGKSVTLDNNRGAGINLRVHIDKSVDPDNIHVEASESITSGHLWEPAMRKDDDGALVPGVSINKHHDFYQKIYQRAAASGYAVEGMDLLLWAFAVAEQNNTNSELEDIFEDIREEISSNLKKLLREVPLPDEEDMAEADLQDE
ncbi:ATP-binding protein [Alisedimentitalea sp. MJ-SS2]|uniref:ATP-binding protein n=1 Tax=Aliisedimentitalea sp. MJ-SS2 TaxID=3049795 RepID=UPI002913BB4E|nr:ATP-binding protein [Alisedimentitalea sp. MJ-SS2]MDU8927681.1 ATP-binding protein [Alisedimentitalea sp. MJ-SS2]